MKKLIRLIEARLVKTSPTEEGFQFSFVDYEPDKEKVNPLEEQMGKLKRTLKEKGRELPPDMMGIIEVFGEMPSALSGQGPPQAYFANAWFFVTRAQYEELGRPMVGDVLSIELAKISIEDILEKEPAKVTCTKCSSVFYARVFPAVCPQCNTSNERGRHQE